MKFILPTVALAAVAAVVTTLAPLPSFAESGRDEAIELDQDIATMPQNSARDRYRTAVQVADATLRKNMAHCATMASGDRAECEREAQDLHEADVAKAGDVLQRPR